MVQTRQFVETLGERFGAVARLGTTPGCSLLGTGCIPKYDRIALSLKSAQSLDSVTTLTKLDDTLADVDSAGVSTASFLDTVDDYDEYFDEDVDPQYIAVWICELPTLTLQSNGARRGCSRTLAKRMEAAGFGKRPDGTAAHHIVASDEGRFPSAIAARAIFDRFNLNINDADNGVYLPLSQKAVDEAANEVPPRILEGAIHSRIHTKVYYDALLNRLENDLSTDATTQELINLLDQIRRELREDTFPY